MFRRCGQRGLVLKILILVNLISYAIADPVRGEGDEDEGAVIKYDDAPTNIIPDYVEAEDHPKYTTSKIPLDDFKSYVNDPMQTYSFARFAVTLQQLDSRRNPTVPGVRACPVEDGLPSKNTISRPSHPPISKLWEGYKLLSDTLGENDPKKLKEIGYGDIDAEEVLEITDNKLGKLYEQAIKAYDAVRRLVYKVSTIPRPFYPSNNLKKNIEGVIYATDGAHSAGSPPNVYILYQNEKRQEIQESFDTALRELKSASELEETLSTLFQTDDMGLSKYFSTNLGIDWSGILGDIVAWNTCWLDIMEDCWLAFTTIKPIPRPAPETNAQVESPVEEQKVANDLPPQRDPHGYTYKPDYLAIEPEKPKGKGALKTLGRFISSKVSGVKGYFTNEDEKGNNDRIGNL